MVEITRLARAQGRPARNNAKTRLWGGWSRSLFLEICKRDKVAFAKMWK